MRDGVPFSLDIPDKLITRDALALIISLCRYKLSICIFYVKIYAENGGKYAYI